MLLGSSAVGKPGRRQVAAQGLSGAKPGSVGLGGSLALRGFTVALAGGLEAMTSAELWELRSAGTALQRRTSKVKQRHWLGTVPATLLLRTGQPQHCGHLELESALWLGFFSSIPALHLLEHARSMPLPSCDNHTSAVITTHPILPLSLGSRIYFSPNPC